MSRDGHFRLLLGGIFFLALIFMRPVEEARSQDPQDGPKPSPVQVERIRLGGHPDDTRVFIQISRPTEYRVIPDFSKKKLGIFIRNARFHPRVKSSIYRDTNLEQIAVSQIDDTVKITVRFKKRNTRFIHFLSGQPTRIVLDLKGSTRPILQAGKGDSSSGSREPKAPREPYIPGVPKSKIKELSLSDSEQKLKAGWEDYQKALKLYQDQNFPEALEAFLKFTETFPESPHLSNVAYLVAETQYKITYKEPFPNYEKALAAYQYAMRRYSESSFYDHGLFKIASIYEDMHYVLEAKTLYLEGMRRDKRSRYNAAREVGLAKMMLSEGRHEEAYAAFKRILRKTPKDQDARKAIFKIARWHYEHNNYPKALKIYEDAVFRWPEELNEKPEVNYFVGEIFFSQKNYKKARQFYYNLVNLDPDAENAHKSLNRIGDSYLLENNGRAALSVFNKSRRTRPGSADSQYGTLRLADVGIQYPALPVRDMIFEVQPYFHPHEAYNEVFEEAQTQEILAEVTLSRGRAFLKEQRYLEALEQFKSLIPLEESSPIRQSAESLAKLAIIHLMDQYSGQEGHLPSLYAYGDFVSLGIGDVQNIKSLLQIGEAYKGIGMNAEALKFFERVKLGDIRGAYTDQLFLNLGEIHLEERKFEEAERVARIFLNKYPNSPRVPDAMKIHAGAYKGQEKFKEALTVYRQLLQRNDVPKAEIQYLMAETHFAAGNLRQSAQTYRQALDNYDRSIRNPPDYIQSSYFKLGIIYHMQQRYADSLDALQAGRTLFPKHSLRPWGDFLIVDNLERLNRKPQAETELKTLVQLKNNDELIQMAAESRLKVLDWEKRLKDQL